MIRTKANTAPNGKFYAVVKQRSIDNAGKTFVCKRAVSPKAAF